jgi:hypothetical protein
LIGFGWAVGHAQRSEPQFVLSIDAPVGETSIECVSGCELIGMRDLGNPPEWGRLKKYSYSCGGPAVARCGASAAGWLVQQRRE